MMYTIQTKFVRQGDLWVGRAKVIGPHGVRTITVQAPISKTLASLKAHGFTAKVAGDEVGWFGSSLIKSAGGGLSAIANAASKLTKQKVVAKLGHAIKDVVKSDITKVAVGTLAVAFPAVGIPAAAALATANTVLDSAEKADRYIGDAKKLGQNMQHNPNGALKAGLAYAITGNANNVKPLFNTPAGRKKLADAAGQIRAGIQAKKVIAETVRRAQAGDPGAIKFAKSLVIAKRARRKLAALKSTVAATRQKPGILVLPSGELLKGSFSLSGASRM